MSEIKLDMIFGRIELKQFHKFENGKMVFYSYRIDYDQHGKETGRTKPEALSSIGWDNGTPFTEIDLMHLEP